MADLVWFCQGKRKRKPKEMIDEISPLVLSRKRKKKLQPSASQSSHVSFVLLFIVREFVNNEIFLALIYPEISSL